MIADLEMEKDDFSLREFEHNFRIAFNPVRRNVFDFWDELIKELKLAGRMGNSRFHKDTSKSVQRFLKWDKDLSFTDITPAFLEKYEAYLRSPGGTDGGIGVRMRSIRALYSHAIRRNIVKESLYPFRAYKVSRLKGRGAKRALNFEEVKQIINVDLIDHPELRDSRNYFVFSFYTRGMNFADMMKLKWKDIKGGNIYYTRSKTKGNFTIKILPPVQEILDYYLKNSLGTKYVFPILLHDELSPNQIENRKTKVLKNYNKDLKAIAELAEIEKSVTSYVARHSFANCLKQKGVATDIISESLGHQNMAITQAYLKELDTSVVNKAIEVLL
ncbi:MAG: tyrosine-type recombinase/integrase [Flagellimonas sp.]